MMTRNIELLERTMQQIKDHPELHDQGAVFIKNECGTAGCFAGWACLLSGLKLARELNDVGDMVLNVLDQDGNLSFATSEARELLGLTREESNKLFAPFNTRSQLEYMVKDLVNGDELKYAYQYNT